MGSKTEGSSINSSRIEGEEGNPDGNVVISLYWQGDVISINNRQKFAQDESVNVDTSCGRRQHISLSLTKHMHSGMAYLPSPFIETID